MYYNLICYYGLDGFYRDAAAAGVNSVLVADLSIDDADEVVPAVTQAGLDTVFMVTPNTSTGRMERIADRTTGFIYTVSLLGVTGSRERLSDAVEGLVRQLKGITSVPVCVGFGISKPEHALTVASAGADGVIIGSKIVGMIEEHQHDPRSMISAISAFITDVKDVLS
jgi:tryptophan synthase alpha chain